MPDPQLQVGGLVGTCVVSGHGSIGTVSCLEPHNQLPQQLVTPPPMDALRSVGKDMINMNTAIPSYTVRACISLVPESMFGP